MESLFGLKIDIESLRKVPTLFVVGDRDRGTKFAEIRKKAQAPVGGRVGVLTRLKDSWVEAGINVELKIVPEAGHNQKKILPDVKAFFEKLVESKSKL